MSSEAVAAVAVLLGLPASGKSTLCNLIIESSTKSSRASASEAKQICSGDIAFVFSESGKLSDEIAARPSDPTLVSREDLSVKCISLDDLVQFGDNWNLRHAYARQLVTRWIHEADAKRTLILVDDNHYYRSMRYVYYKIAARNKAAYVELHCKCSLETALRRNSARAGSGRVPDEAILQINEKFEAPDPSRSNVVEIDTELDIQIPSELWKDLFRKIPEIKHTEEKKEERQSLLHQLDLKSRQAMNEILKSCSKEEKLAFAKSMNAKRREFLDLYRSSPMDDSSSSECQLEEMLREYQSDLELLLTRSIQS